MSKGMLASFPLGNEPLRLSARGQGTEFQRELEFDPGSFRTRMPDAPQMAELMHVQSEQALGRLKTLIEKILEEETRGAAA